MGRALEPREEADWINERLSMHLAEDENGVIQAWAEAYISLHDGDVDLEVLAYKIEGACFAMLALKHEALR